MRVREKAANTARTGGALALLVCALPANAAITALLLLARHGRHSPDPRRTPEPDPAAPRHRPTVLLTGGKMTKALVLARAFHRAGHRVVLVETARYRFTGHRFSAAVDAFRVVPESDADDYVEEMVRVAREERVELFVPVCSPASSTADARVATALRPWCDVLFDDEPTVASVDDKHAFTEQAAALGLAVPRSHRVTDPQQVLDLDLGADGATWILKSIAYDPVGRTDLTRLPAATPATTAAYVRSLPISKSNPWILQEFVEGTEYCTHSTVHAGRTTVFTCCRSSAVQLNYAPVDHPGVEAWVARFVEGLGLTGQYSFDLIERADGEVLAIECNPRTHSAISLLRDHPGLAAAYVDPAADRVTPPPDARPTYWLYHEAWRAIRRPWTLRERARTVARGADAIFDADDPLPFLAVHHLQVPSLLLGHLRRLTPWSRIDFNIGKLVEPAGD